MPPLKGDFAALERWERKFGRIGDARTAFEIADGMSDAALALVAESFGREADPFGKAWKPRKVSTNRPILRGKTNRLVRWRKAFVNQHGYRISSTAPYAGYHQSGTRHMPARKMVPTGRLPPKWASEFRGVFIRRMHALLK
jgi:hypothetical protein